MEREAELRPCSSRFKARPLTVEYIYSRCAPPDPISGCRIWLYHKRNGYGGVSRNGREECASRMVYVLTHGEIPSDIHVLHTCDDRACCESSHLFAGTRSDNMRDMVAKDRNFKQAGEANHRSKLTWTQVGEIRARYARGCTTTIALGEEYGVSSTNIGDIVFGKRWYDGGYQPCVNRRAELQSARERKETK